MKILFKRLSSTARVPQYATAGAAGMDLHADIEATIKPGETRLIPTNIAIQLPDNFEAQIRPRSGLAFNHRVTVLNSPGTIDPDYRGGIGVLLHNTHDVNFHVKPGDRIAQMVIAPFFRVELAETERVVETKRGEGGFGSTGVSANPTKLVSDQIVQVDPAAVVR